MWFTKILDLVTSFSKVHEWSLWFALCNAFSHLPTNLKVLACPSYGLSVLQSANRRDHSCTFGKSWGLNALQSANHRNHSCTFGKLGTKSKILVNHTDGHYVEITITRYKNIKGNLYKCYSNFFKNHLPRRKF
ncbi:hypothetical protein Hanom_Chr01g00029161 [Helianthus anomalus]